MVFLVCLFSFSDGRRFRINDVVPVARQTLKQPYFFGRHEELPRRQLAKSTAEKMPSWKKRSKLLYRPALTRVAISALCPPFFASFHSPGEALSRFQFSFSIVETYNIIRSSGYLVWVWDSMDRQTASIGRLRVAGLQQARRTETDWSVVRKWEAVAHIEEQPSWPIC